MDNNTNKKPNKVNMPKFNLNWLYMIIAMMLLGLYLTNESGTATKNISYDEFQQYVRDGYISKVIGYLLKRRKCICCAPGTRLRKRP